MARHVEYPPHGENVGYPGLTGHGSYTQDYTGEEGDGRDETIVPVDHETAGHLTDDDILQQVSGRGLMSEGATAQVRRSPHACSRGKANNIF